MPQCKWCSKKGFFLSLSKKSLCKSCQLMIETKINNHARVIKSNIKVLGASEEKEKNINHCDEIIEKARELLRYEKKGISTIDPSPSKLIKEFTTTHDKLIIKSVPEKVNEALLSAESALLPYNEIYSINEVLNKIKTVRTVLPELLVPKIFALINQKGGVGKTTSTINLGAGLAKLKKKVLLIDFDPQANLTDGLGTEEKDLKYTIYNILKSEVNCKNVIINNNENMSFIPSHVFLAKSEKEFSREARNIFLLKNALKGLTGYDYVLIDCPPSLGILTLNALAAAQSVIIPLQPEYYALKGIRKLMDIIDFVKGKINRRLTIVGIICTRYDNRKIHHREVLGKIRESLGDSIFYTVIRENISLAESSSFGQTIFEYKPKSHGAEDYMNLSKEVIERNTINNKKNNKEFSSV